MSRALFFNFQNCPETLQKTSILIVHAQNVLVRSRDRKFHPVTVLTFSSK